MKQKDVYELLKGAHMNIFEEIRKEYPAVENQVYLDTATTGLISKKSYEAMKNQLDSRHFEGVNIGSYFGYWDYADGMRKMVAEMINAKEHEVFYGKDCSDINNAFTSNIEIPEGSNVVMADISFPAMRNAWLAREKDGLEVRFVKSINGEVPFESMKEMIDENTLAVSVCYVEPSSGFKHDLNEIGEFCYNNGILLAVDITQCIGAMHMDVKKLHVDFLASSTYKWMNNVFGFGIGYMSTELLNKITPHSVGWVGSRDRRGDFNQLELSFNKGAQRFETGGLNWLGMFGFEQSLITYMSLGKKEVENYILSLVDYLYKRVEEFNTISIVEPFEEKNRSNIVYLKFPKAYELTDDVLGARGIRAHVATDETMRIGLHFYNNAEDINALMAFFDECEK